MSDSQYMPQVDAPGIIMHGPKHLADSLTMDLSDEQIRELFDVILPIRQKWQRRFIARFASDAALNVDSAMRMVEQFEDELKTTAAERCQVLVTVDVSPVLEGGEMIIDIVGALSSHDINKYGLDHERKAYEVVKAKGRNEDWLGQKGNADATRTKRRAT